MSESFGSMLRRHRLACGLTQEALAERASLSPTAIAALERGRNRSPRMSTLRQLARALELNREEVAALSRAVTSEEPDARDWAAGEGPVRPEVSSLDASLAASPAVPSGTGTARIPLPPPVARRWRTDFVGRATEMGQLRGAWEQRRRLIEVIGESGIGKTRLVAEMVRSLPDETTVLWGRCSQDHLGSYVPYVEIVRHLVAEADPARLRLAVGTRGELTRLVPGLVDRVGPLPAPTRAEAGSEQRLLFEAIAALLAPWTPLLLVIDDLHWADGATLALLAYLVRDHHLPGLVTVVTARPSDLDPMASGLVAELGRDVDFDRIRLGRLSGADLASLVADLVGSPVGAQLVHSVESATEGNPFFAEEMTLHLVDSGLVIDADGGVLLDGDPRRAGVPERVRETVVRRLLSLSSDGMKLLSVGAVIGREFELSVAASASELGGNRLVDASDDALLSGMVVESGPGRLSFSHVLLRDAISGRLSSARRASIHREVALTIEDQWPAAPSVAAELARHWAAVAEVDPTATTAAATWAVRAGDLALASAAAEEAIARYEQASALWSSASVGHADALIRLGVALQYRGRADEADTRFQQATQLAVALGDPILRARAALGLGRRYPYWETDRARINALEAALAALPPGEQVLRVMLMGLLVTQLITGFEPGQAERRDALADELSSIAADAGSAPELLMAIGQTRIYDCIEDPATLSDVADRLLEVAQARSDLRVEAGARFAHALASLDRGDMASLKRASADYLDVAARLDDPRERSQAAMVRSTVGFIEGRYDDAATLSDEALDLGKASGDFNAELLHYAQGLLRAVDQGLAAEVLPLLVASTDYHHIASFDAGTILCAALAGDRDLAQAGLQRLAASGFQGSPRGADWVAPTAFLAHACCLIGARPEAAALYDALSRAPGTVVRVGPLAGWWGPVDHHLGCLARLLGRHDEAERRLGAALAIEEAMGAGPFAARTKAELARVVAVADPTAGAKLAGEAVAAAEGIGAAGILREVHAAIGAGGSGG